MEQDRDPQLLWRRTGAGDRRAFTALYERYEEDVVRFCRALLRDGDDAREAANSTWASVWRARAAAGRGVELRPWLFRIAHNEAVDILRRRRPHEPLDAGLAGPADPVADAELHERLAVLHADLMALTDHQRTALVLRELSGLGHDEIAAALGVSAAAAKQAIYEGRRALIEAEGGRSLSCDLVRRDLATGDRRVLRGRRLRAHLRSCAPCREVATDVAHGRRDPRVLLPAPLAALLARLLPGRAASAATSAPATGLGGARPGPEAGHGVARLAPHVALGVARSSPEAAVGAGATAAAAGGRLTAPLLAKAAAGAVAVALGTPHHPDLHKPPRPAAPQVASVHQHAVSVRAERPAAKGRAVVAKPSRIRRSAAATSSPGGATSAAPARATAAAQPAPAAAPAKPVAPGQAKQGATASPSASAPGKLKKADQSAMPPGQAKRQAAAPAAALPPGQAKKQAAAPSAAAATPAPAAAPPAASVAPGQVAKQNAASAPAAALPPGQAKRG